MTRGRSIAFLAGAAVIPLTALAVGCGSSGGGSATASTPPPKKTSAPSVAVRVTNTHLGKILVDSKGRTLYLFTKDSTKKSACSGMCATFWPPLRAGKPTAGRGARSSLVGTIKRSDGTSQVTYHGHPLYRFLKDTKPGEINGQGVTAFGGSWFAVSPAGNRVSPPSKTSSAQAAPPTPQASPPPAAPPAPQASPPPAAPPAPQASPTPSDNGIPQNGGGDDDADNNGGPDDGDGGV